MKTICCGYKKKDGKLIPCGRVIKPGPEPDNNCSSGICDECFDAFKKEHGFMQKTDGYNPCGQKYLGLNLSDAIRKGCNESPVQGFDDFFSCESGRVSCVLGAAWVGRNGVENIDGCDFKVLANQFPILDAEIHPLCPVEGCSYDLRESSIPYKADLHNLVVHMNDQHKMTREEIADYVESLELEAFKAECERSAA